MRKNVSFVAGVVAPVLLMGVAALVGCGGEKAAPHGGAPTVSVVTVGTRSEPQTAELPGRTVACRTAEIRPRVNGLILERLFEEGADVVEGQPLYKIDPAPYRADLDAAKAALSQAEANLTAIKLRKERFEELLPTSAVSRQDYDDAVAGLKQAQAAVEAAKARVSLASLNLEYTDVAAPITGRIGRSYVTVGAMVTAYQPQMLARIQQLDPIYVDLPQSTAEVATLRRHLADGRLDLGKGGGRNVRLIEEDGTAYALPGSLQFRGVSVDPTTGSVNLRALFENPDAELLPDMFVRCVVTEGVMPQAVLVMQQAVARDPKGNPYVWLVDADDKAQIRPLQLGRAVKDEWLVISGLEAGDRVVVEGLQYLRQAGTPVHAVPYAPEAAPADGGAGAKEAAHQDKARAE